MLNTPRFSIRLTICLLVGISALGAVEMPERVYVSAEDLSAFRYPRAYTVPDLYGGAVHRPGKGVRLTFPPGKDRSQLTPAEYRKIFMAAWADPLNADVLHRGIAIADLPDSVKADDPAAVAKHLSFDRLSSAEAFDYYAENPARPFTDAKWAPEGILAYKLSGEGYCGILYKHDERYSMLMASGGFSDHDNQEIMDSFEVLGGRSRSRMTWVQNLCRKGLTDFKGASVKAGSKGPGSWSDGYAIETDNYVVSGNLPPKLLHEYAGLMEVLFETFSSLFKPAETSGHKMQIHVASSHSEMHRLGAANGHNAPPTAGGWFSPGSLSIFVHHSDKQGYTAKVLAHEASHQFLHMTCNGSAHVPTWINEGLAVYFEAGKYSSRGSSWQPPKIRVKNLQYFYGQRGTTLWPLGRYPSYYGHIPGENYAEVYAITHFWLFGQRGGKERFQKYWKALKAGEDGTEAFERIFMADMIKAKGGRDKAVKAWTEALVEYVKKGRPLKN